MCGTDYCRPERVGPKTALRLIREKGDWRASSWRESMAELGKIRNFPAPGLTRRDRPEKAQSG